MGFLDLFRKKKLIDIEKVPFEKLTSWVELKTQTLTKEKTSFINKIKSRISQLNDELERGIKDLNEIDWEKIKTEERIKNIVKENLKNYILHLEQLKLDLGNLNEVKLDKINSIFASFNKRAEKNYQKSAFLVGKDLAVINESMSNFFKDLNKLQKGNKTLLERVEVISNVRNTLKDLENTQKLILEINSGINKIHDKVETLQSKIKEINNQIKKIKESKDFQAWQAKYEQYTNAKHKRDSKIVALRGMIDLKSLAKIWHENKTEMKIIKGYRENFEKAFDEDRGEVLKELITSLDNKDVIHKNMREIFDLEREVEITILEKSLTSDLEEDIKIAQSEIENLNAEKTRKVKRIERLGIEKEKIRKVIRDSLKEIGIEVV